MQKCGLAFIPYFPLASGLLTGKYRRNAPTPAGTRLAGKNRLSDAVLERAKSRAHLSDRRFLRPAQSSTCWVSRLRWLLESRSCQCHRRRLKTGPDRCQHEGDRQLSAAILPNAGKASPPSALALAQLALPDLRKSNEVNRQAMSAMRRIAIAVFAAGVALFACNTSLLRAAPCRTSGSFDPWLEQFKQRGAGARHFAQCHRAGLALSHLRSAHRQHRSRPARVRAKLPRVLDRMLPGGRISQGQAQLKKNAATFAREEQQYGVPPRGDCRVLGTRKRFRRQPWARIIRSARSRRWPMIAGAPTCFATICSSALKLLDRGDLTAPEMVGSWAGELGQTQMMPTRIFQIRRRLRWRRPPQPAAQRRPM